jgi:hypothetical protein
MTLPSPLNEPTLRDDLPRYPPLLQMLRLTATQVAGPSGFAQAMGSSVLGPTLYVSFTQQMRDDGSLLPRDREPCLADDVNGLGLTPGFYLGRLAGSFNSLPVYEVCEKLASGTSPPPPPPVTNPTIMNQTITLASDTITETNTNTTFIASSYTINNLTLNSPRNLTTGVVNNFTGLTINSWLEICGYQDWCCTMISFSTSSTTDWIPNPPATVYVIENGTATILQSMIPIGAGKVQQTSVPVKTQSGISLAGGFGNSVTIGSAIIVTAWGKSAAVLTSPGVTDSNSNSYTQDSYVQDSTSGLWIGKWRYSGLVAGPLTFSFSYTGTAGTIEMVAEEVQGLIASPVDQESSAFGSGSIPFCGAITPGAYFEYFSLGMATAEAEPDVTITPPAGTANFYTEVDGVAYVAGSADFQNLGASVAALSGDYRTDASARWVACGVTYKTMRMGQLTVFQNSSTIPFTIANNGSYTNGKPIFYPADYGTLTLEQYDSAALWYDDCDDTSWRLLWTTVPPEGYDFIVTDGSTSVTMNSGAVLTLNGAGSSTVTVNGAGGSATATVNSSGGGSSLTTTNKTVTDTGTSTITTGVGIAYSKGAGGSNHNDTFSLGFSGAKEYTVGTVTISSSGTPFVPTSSLPPNQRNYDTDSYWGNLTLNPSSATIPFTGYYSATLNVRWNSSVATATPQITITNTNIGLGVDLVATENVVNASSVTPSYNMSCSGDFIAIKGDTVQFTAAILGAGIVTASAQASMCIKFNGFNPPP